MKTISALIVLFFIGLLAGCANMSEVSGPVSSDEGTAVVNFKINLEKTGVVRKMAAGRVYEPTILVTQTGIGWPFQYDTLPITGSTMSPSFTLKKGDSCQIVFSTRNPLDPNYVYQAGSVRFRVPNSDTFSLSVTLEAATAIMELVFPLKGSLVYNTANKVVWRWDWITNGADWGDSLTASFAPGTLDTVRFTGLLPVNYGEKFTLRIENVDGSYYLGLATILMISPGIDYNVEIKMTKYDPNGSVLSATVVLAKVGKAGFWVSGIY